MFAFPHKHSPSRLATELYSPPVFVMLDTLDLGDDAETAVGFMRDKMAETVASNVHVFDMKY